MRLLSLVRPACMLLLALCVISCDEKGGFKDDSDQVATFFRKHKCGSSPDYAIQIQSTVEPMRWDHVITVHGFVDDFGVCQKLVNYLNQSTNDHYRAVPLNQ